MQTKLTLRMDAELIQRAKAYARRSGKSLSEIVAQLFGLIAEADRHPAPPLTPTVKSLLGVLRGHKVREQDYYRHLEKKHR